MPSRTSHALLTTVLTVSTLAVGCSSSPKPTATTAEDNGRKAAANFSLPDSDGVKVALVDYKGKVVLLNFWATWCPPCRREMPDMEKLYQLLSQKGLVVLAVSDEKRETVEDFLKKQNYTFPVLLDPDGKVNAAFGIEGIPNSFLFDRQGKLLQVRPRGATARSSSFGVGRVPHAA